MCDDKKRRRWLKFAYASLRNINLFIDRDCARGCIKTSVTKAHSCHSTVCRANNNNPCKDAAMPLVCVRVCLCMCESIKIQQNPPDIQSVLVTMATPAPKRQSASER